MQAARLSVFTPPIIGIKSDCRASAVVTETTYRVCVLSRCSACIAVFDFLLSQANLALLNTTSNETESDSLTINYVHAIYYQVSHLEFGSGPPTGKPSQELVRHEQK